MCHAPTASPTQRPCVEPRVKPLRRTLRNSTSRNPDSHGRLEGEAFTRICSSFDVVEPGFAAVGLPEQPAESWRNGTCLSPTMATMAI